MDPIKRMAIEFGHKLGNTGYTFEKIDNEINSKLAYIIKDNEKLRFLSYLNDIAESEYKDHAKDCYNPNSCPTNQAYENALYSIRQNSDLYSDTNGSTSFSEKPAMKFFNDGQYFDAYTELREIIKKAKSSILLVDGYVDMNTLSFFPAKDPKIKLRILTNPKSLNDELNRAVELYNKQYKNLKIKTCEKFHDRFLILDDKNFFHIGASLKDAGNKAFMYTEITGTSIIKTIRTKTLEEWPDI